MPSRRVVHSQSVDHVAHLKGMGLTMRQIRSVPSHLHPQLVHHMSGGNKFTDFFKKSLPNFFKKTLPDAFSQKHIEERLLNPLRDFVNPALAKGIPILIGKLPVPGAEAISNAMGKIGDQYLKVMPPLKGPFVGSGALPKGTRTCKLCGSVGAVSSTCPLNVNALHKKHSKHPMAKMIK